MLLSVEYMWRYVVVGRGMLLSVEICCCSCWWKYVGVGGDMLLSVEYVVV